MVTTRLMKYFREYYYKSPLGIPDMLFQREIGFIPFNGTMTRHRKFNGQAEIEDFVRRSVPRHLYYSSSYYRFPDQHKMLEKEWLGAELIFDLDADHIEGADKMTYMEILAEVKKHTLRLLEMLMDDFGFGNKNIRLYFSGGRGYHVHVESARRFADSGYIGKEDIERRKSYLIPYVKNGDLTAWWNALDLVNGGYLASTYLSPYKDVFIEILKSENPGVVSDAWHMIPMLVKAGIIRDSDFK